MEKYYAFEETKGKVIGSVKAETCEEAEKLIIYQYGENVTAMAKEDFEEMEAASK